MARISQEEKERIRQKILDVSKVLFLGVGYENTSTKMIAKEVGIAEGTIFNYFPSKTDILFESIYDNYFENIEEYQEIFKIEENISKAIFDYLLTTLKIVLKVPKGILSELTIQSMKMAKKNPTRFKKMAELDIKYMKELEKYIMKLVDKGLLKDVDSRQLSELIYSAVVFEVLMYLYDKKLQKDDMKENIKTKIIILMKGYIKGGKK